MWVKFLSRNSEVFKIYTNYLSCLVYNQVYNLFVCTLCPCLTSFPQWNWDMQSTVQRNSRSLDMSRATCHRAVLDLIALRKHDKAIFSELWRKKKIDFALTCCRYAIEWTDNLNYYFIFFTVQFHLTCLIPDETKKILGPKINRPHFQALISRSPEIFPWRIKWYGTPKKEK